MPQTSRLPLLCAALLSTSALADTFTLKTGERFEAKILSETATEMTLEVQISAGIKDEKVVKKADVVKLDRVAPDENAYRAIMNLLPGKNTLLPAQYDSIQSALQNYAAQYPESGHVAEVKQALAGFQADKKRVDAGEMKVDGVWLNKAQVAQQRLQIGGLQAFNAMKSANAAGDAIGALNAYVGLEKGFGGAKVMPDAIELARQILPVLKPAVERALENQKIKEAERLADVKNAMTVPEVGKSGKAPTAEQLEQIKATIALSKAKQDELIAANQREQAKTDAALAAATTAGLWPPMAASSEKCLKAIQMKIPVESARLEKLPVADMRESIRLAEQAQTEITDKDLVAANETLKEALKLWPANELGKRLNAQLTALKNPPKTDPATTPATTPAATAAKSAATPTPKSPAAPPTAVRPATPAAAATPVPAAAAPASEPAESKPAEEPPKPFFRTVPGAITIVVALALLLAGVNVFNKIRQRSNASEE